MAYLTFSEYQDFSTTVKEMDFTNLIGAAESAIDMATRDYYQINSLDSDINARRVNDFKHAVAEQVDYYAFAQATKSYEIQQGEYKAVSIGRLSLTPTDASAGLMPNGLCKEAYELLAKHGLLFRGAW